MSIAPDMNAPLTVLARLRATLAQDPACRSHVELLGACIATLEDCRERAEALERTAAPPAASNVFEEVLAEIARRPAVPAHTLPQRVPLWDELCGGAVVSLMAARQARALDRRARL